MITVLFACVHNAGRSQIAAALFNRDADPRKARAISAGTNPAEQVHPEVVALMRDMGIDLSGQRPQKLTQALASKTQWLITMGCGDECPVVPGAQRDDWPLADPKGRSAAEVRDIAAEIELKVRRLVQAQGWSPPRSPE